MKRNILLIAAVAFASTIILSSCKKVPEECEEFFEQGCPVTQEYEPVCGCNNKTYANSSVADCAGINYTVGACN